MPAVTRQGRVLEPPSRGVRPRHRDRPRVTLASSSASSVPALARVGTCAKSLAAEPGRRAQQLYAVQRAWAALAAPRDSLGQGAGRTPQQRSFGSLHPVGCVPSRPGRNDWTSGLRRARHPGSADRPGPIPSAPLTPDGEPYQLRWTDTDRGEYVYAETAADLLIWRCCWDLPLGPVGGSDYGTTAHLIPPQQSLCQPQQDG